MKKTSLYLEPDLDRRLAQLAAEQGITKAAYIRQALRDRVEASAAVPIRAIGVGAGPGDVAADVDGHLADSGFGT